MKGRSAIVLLGAVALCSLAVGMQSQRGAVARSPSGEVILLRCKTGADFAVVAYQGSASAPSKKSNSCPETLSLLLKDGFVIHDVGHSVDVDFVVYTLMR